MLHSSLPTSFATLVLQTSSRNASPEIGSGSGSYTHLKKVMRLLSVHWSSFPQLKLVESVGNAPTSTCLQSRCIACLPRPQNENGRLPPCCPEPAEFWSLGRVLT